MASNSNIPISLQNNILNPSTLPLWNANTIYIDRQKLYDLEIYYNDGHIDIEKDVDAIQNMNVSKCHICDISVPNSYVQEHLTSTKHKTFSKIANIALKRTQKHMTTDMFAKMDKLKMEVKETHFCEVCAVVVKNSDKEKHAMTNEHQNYDKNDKLMRHLVDIYEEPQKRFGGDHCMSMDVLKISDVESDDKESVISYETHTATKVTKDNNKTIKEEQFNNSTSKINDMSKNVTNEDAKCDVKDSKNTQKTKADTEPIASTTNTNKERIAPQYQENLVELKQYIHVARYIHKDTIYPTAISEVTVEIVAANVDRVKVPVENFHGFRVTGKAVVCKLCPVIESVDGKKHKWTDLHMKNIMLPLTKEHLRQLSESTVHCLLCNTTHSSSESTSHTSSSKHEENFNRYESTNDLTEKNKQIALANNLTWTPDSMSCRFCQFKTKKSSEALNNHVLSSNHLKKLDAFLTYNKIFKMPIENGCYWCGVCQKKIGVYLRSHCVSFEHKRSLKSFNGVVPI